MRAEGTGRTETSHVARGTETIPVVVANEPGDCLNRVRVKAAAVADPGLEDIARCAAAQHGVTLRTPQGVWNTPP